MGIAGRIGLMCNIAAVLCLVVPTGASEREVSNPEALQTALNQAQAGDTIVMTAQNWPNLELRIEHGGKPDNPVTIQAAARGKTRLTGASRLDIAANYIVVDGLTFTDGAPKNTVITFREDTKHNRVTNCSIVNYNAGPDVERPPMWVSVRGANHRIDHCAFTERRDVSGLLRIAVEDEPRHHRIDHNYFGPFALSRKNGGETIRIIDNSQPTDSHYVRRPSRTTVEYNLFEDCDGEAAEIISNKSSENIYRGNTFRRSMGALTLRQGRGCIVEGNFFFGEHKSGTMGVRVLGTDHRVTNNYFEALVGKGYTGTSQAAVSIEAGYAPNTQKKGYRAPVKGLTLANNTIVNCERSLMLGRGFSGATEGPTDCIIRDNIVVSSEGRLVTVLNHPERILWEGNIVHGELGIAVQPGITIANPIMQRGENGLMRPEGKQTAGTTLVGADGQIYRPLKPEDVGPFGTMGR